jgi:transcriptional regulator with XRE-family HTH domain
MPFSAPRFNRVVALKGLTQPQLAQDAKVSQSQISESTKGVCRSNELTEKLARALNCTPDFLLGWSFHGVDDDDTLFRAAVSRMAYDVFAARIDVGADLKIRCRRVLEHPEAPITAVAWKTLSEQIEMAGSPSNGELRIHRGGK